ncbi:hypothetical protein GGH94_004456 [Coemansia aciculifera]|uniref:Wings apart-like protein C-terminal domain-containing protein n=1 Tax=Coemansia aciculifera TaxID=417176 RepID=A0A9W8ILT8_9FUNG|nr:hypothetical protein GGH94_004456 [Coemansia aciculifera]
MSDPFSNIRRKPAAATYGRRALAARRVGSQSNATNSDAVFGLASRSGSRQSLIPVALLSSPTIGGDATSTMSASESESDGNMRVLPPASVKDSEVGGKLWARRSAQSTMSKLESLYESTQTRTVVPSNQSARAILDSAKNNWDLGEANEAHAKPQATVVGSGRPAQRISRNNTNLSNAVKAAKAPFPAKSKPVVSATSAPALAARPDKAPDAPPLETMAKAVPGKAAKSKPSQPKRARNDIRGTDLQGTPVAQQSACLQLKAVESPSKVAKAMRGSHAVPVHRQQQQLPPKSKTAHTNDSPWDMVDLLASSPIPVQTRATRRPVAARTRGRKPQTSSDIASSSPPSTPGRLLDLGKSSQPSSSLGDSDGEGTFAAAAAATPKAQVANRRTLEAIQGPSLATSKRLQARAYSQNVVYTYGRTRDDDDLEEFGRALAIPGMLGMNSQPLLGHRESDVDSDSAADSLCLPAKWRGAPASSTHLLDLADSVGDNSGRKESSVPFKKRLGAIIHGLNASALGSAATACSQLLDGLVDEEFRDELLGSKSWLPTLLQSMHRARDDPAVLPTAMLVIAMAFGVPATMQTLVFERQVLETVAEILKPTAETEILLLRRQRDFTSAEYHHCAAQICYLARQCNVVSESLPQSTYNLALAALHSFTRSDDVAYLAMARLLRSEITLDSDASDEDDLWMDFDLPEEEKHAPGATQASSGYRKDKSGVAKIGQRTRTTPAAATSVGNLGKPQHAERLLLHEPGGSLPSFASIALELELLRFCTTESVDNQSEVLAIDSCVPLLLSLLAMCQQASTQLQGAALVRALEIAALTLQLLVNLSNSSTVFCARFIARQGLDVVSKSIAFVSQKLDQPASSIEHGTSEFSPRRKALVDNASDLRYDILLVTSALLTNVVDSDPSSALYFSHVLQSPQCALSSRCFPECACKGRLPLAVLLTRAFLACHSACAIADAAVAAGYLSVLLGLLVREKTTGRESILRLLPGQSTTVLIKHIEDFIRVSDAVNQRFAGLFGGLAFMSQSKAAPTLHESRRPLLTNGDHQGSNDTTSIAARAPNKEPATQSKIAASLRGVIDMLGNI